MTDRTAHARLIKLGADILKQRHWGDRINTADALRQDEALAALGYEAGQIAKMIAAPSQPEGAPTGWPPGMLQDDDRKLSRALAATPHARAHADEAAAAIRAAQPEEAEPTWPKLMKPATVGAGTFGVGVSARLVVESAQRHYEWAQEERDNPKTPEQQRDAEMSRRRLWDMLNGVTEAGAATQWAEKVRFNDGPTPNDPPFLFGDESAGAAAPDEGEAPVLEGYLLWDGDDPAGYDERFFCRAENGDPAHKPGHSDHRGHVWVSKKLYSIDAALSAPKGEEEAK